ncbi:amphi-Trp domain-containing protein [Pseudonocardia sp. RS010]|uniref:amphi-Trp domain-containing protein n=1 Tax=Pseudonocardia sp. RS010 TaxID=3385979 RepID=UPI0039A3AFF1
MSDVEVTYSKPVSRKEAARTLAALADALADSGKVELELGRTSMTVHVPGDIRCKVEVEIDGDEVEFEVELTWSTAAQRQSGPAGTQDRVTAAGKGEAEQESGASTRPGAARATDGPDDQAAEPAADTGKGGRPANRRKADAR